MIKVICPGCNRKVAFDMLRDTRLIPVEVWPHNVMCDACEMKLTNSGKFDRATLYELAGHSAHRVALIMDRDRGIVQRKKLEHESTNAAP